MKMSLSIQAVRGIGPSAVTILADNGIKTVEDLAAKTPLQLATIKTFSKIRAKQVIKDANALIRGNVVAKPINSLALAPKKVDEVVVNKSDNSADKKADMNVGNKTGKEVDKKLKDNVVKKVDKKLDKKVDKKVDK
jgi:predicted RecB family nuclease